MSIDISQWRAQIGLHNSFKFGKKPGTTSWKLLINLLFVLLLVAEKLLSIVKKIKKNLCWFLPVLKSCILPFLWGCYLLMMCNDIEKNPGPCKQNYLKIFHWNLNSIKTDNYSRVSLIEAFNSHSNYDIIGLSETALHRSDEDTRLLLDGYHSPIRRDIIDEDESYGGVLFFVKDSIPFTERPDLETVKNQLIIETNISRKR